MTLLSRYVSGTVASAILLVLFLVVGLDVVSALIDQLEDLSGQYTFAQAGLNVAMTIPGRFTEYFPLSVLIGCLAGVGMLAQSNEVTVMRATGVSLLKLFGWTIRPVLMLALLSLAISEFVSPVTDSWAKTHKDLKLLGESYSQVSSGGLWHKQGDSYMHFNVVQPGGVLLGLKFFQLNAESQLVLARSARRATFVDEAWLLEDVKDTVFSQHQTIDYSRKTLVWQTTLTPEALAFLASKPQNLSVSDLWQYVAYLDRNKLDSQPYRLAFWQKVLQPIETLSLLVIALSFVFGPLRSSTMGFKVFVGVVIGIGFQFAQNLLGPASLIYGFAPLSAVLIPIAFCGAIGALLLRRTA